MVEILISLDDVNVSEVKEIFSDKLTKVSVETRNTEAYCET